MSKKRYGDLRLNNMSRDELLTYAKRITRDHGRAQESINRLITRVQELEQQTGEAAPVQGEPHRFAPTPHQVKALGDGYACRTTSHPVQHRRMVLRNAGGSSNG